MRFPFLRTLPSTSLNFKYLSFIGHGQQFAHHKNTSLTPNPATIIKWTLIILSILTTACGTEEDESQLSLRRQVPFYNAELYKVLRQHYKFQDFLWAGSGEGPVPSENQDGLAWEDDGLLGHSSGQIPIKITKTMVLYKTVLSTIYPVAMTPIVVTSTISVTPTISMTIEPIFSSSISPTATLASSILVQPTVTASPPPHWSTQRPEDTSETDRLLAFATDPHFWIQTSIKRKRDGYHPNDIAFQELLQNKLAEVYATAFKRQLLKSLRLSGKTDSNGTVSKRNRRASILASFGNVDYEEDAETNPLYYYLKGTSAIVKTAMNVSVSMINVTWEESNPRIDLKYIVYAEGNPIQGFVAVRELHVVSKEEMEDTLGYEIINKAEALIQPLERNELGSVASSTPWLIALMALVFLMTMILMITLFMAWKWRHNRLRTRGDETTAIAQSSRDHAPSPQSDRAIIDSEQGRRSLRGPSSSVFAVGKQQQQTKGGPIGTPVQPPRPPQLNIEEESGGTGSTEQSEDKSSHGLLDNNQSEGSSYSPQRRLKSKSSSVARKVHKKRRSKRLKHGSENEEELKTRKKDEQSSFRDSSEANRELQEKDFSFTGDICRNLDKISMRNLDIYPDSDVRTPSAQTKKILSRPSSHEQKKKQQFSQRDDDESEKSFEVAESSEIDKKDVQVQTPTRLKRKDKTPRLRTSPRHRSKTKSSKMSLVSTESEEAVEFTHLQPSSLEDANPIGCIRKRFHQFLDDAFNVMSTTGVRRDSSGGKAPQSARVTVSHQMKTKSPSRPWTSHVIREESVRKIRPKSSLGVGPPKSAWTERGSERRVQSAKSKTSTIEEENQESCKNEMDTVVSSVDELQDEEQQGQHSKILSSRSTSTVRTECQKSSSEHSHSTAYLFPKYPAFPEVEAVQQSPHWAGPSSSSRLHPTDPAVPLIEAIKDEMKRFEKVKVSSTKKS